MVSAITVVAVNAFDTVKITDVAGEWKFHSSRDTRIGLEFFDNGTFNQKVSKNNRLIYAGLGTWSFLTLSRGSSYLSISGIYLLPHCTGNPKNALSIGELNPEISKFFGRTQFLYCDDEFEHFRKIE